jgi:AraC-like DNA-binding protein
MGGARRLAPVTVAERSGLAIVRALARLGYAPPNARVADDASLAAVWRYAIAKARRRTLPLEVGLGMPLGEMGVVDYLAAASASVGEAMTVAQQVFPLVAPEVQLGFEALRGGRRRVVILNQPPFEGQNESDLLVLGIVLARLRALAVSPLAPRIELVERSHETAFRRLLSVDRLVLGARRTSFELSAKEWSVPLRTADPRLLELLRSTVGPAERSLDAHLVAVRALARDRLPHTLALDDAARSLGVSRRTLQRRLACAGTSLSELVDEARKERALHLVDQRLLTLSEVGNKVGYAEAASFTRAWTRWFGRPPSQRTERRS